MTSGPKLWRGQTLQDRSGERREQLLDCAFDLLGTAGAGAVTMRAVARQANLSPRYFYESFDNREVLVTAVYDRVEAALRERLSTIASTGDPHAAIRAALERCADFFEEDPRRARVLLREPLADDNLRRHITRRTPAVIRALAPILGAGAEALFASSDAVLATIGTALAGALTAVYLEWADGNLVIERDRLVDTAVGIVVPLLAVTSGG
ncbi:putative transcriptional regulator, TetR family [Nocardia nova SH22a]|uniref:Putative transcriptional regulator, TetR family n=1 Tax=Nocardia nova SH22a TaxID=1415166 RepID=W5TNS5_9NOCA|nr:TetR/AcrR family transcriptional regulator [Nocardia nova]AHH21020.1 putative transcriptional regulator, TetR family [Nocardia nova SH22a]